MKQPLQHWSGEHKGGAGTKESHCLAKKSTSTTDETGQSVAHPLTHRGCTSFHEAVLLLRHGKKSAGRAPI